MSTHLRCCLLTALLASALGLEFLSAAAAAEKVCERSASDNPPELIAPLTASPNADFSGSLRLYVVEPDSRWNDCDGYPYHNALLDIPLDTAIALTTGDRFVRSRIWDAPAAGYTVTESNIMVIAVLFVDTFVTNYSNPPYQNPFPAFYADAAAYAVPGSCDSNNTTGNSTHTVFVEEATSTGCPSCPATSFWLNYIHSTGSYNFIFTALVYDRNADANTRLDEFNCMFLPTTYYDGGDELTIGGWDEAGPYQSALAAADSRAVIGANVMLKLTWLDGDLQIDYVLTLDAPTNTFATPAAPTGETEPLVNNPYFYTVNVNDPEGDRMWYQFDWGDGAFSDWQGPYASGDPCSQTHQWQTVGTYDVRVKSRDFWLGESDWSAPLTVNAECCIKPGDFNDDGEIKVSDLTALIAYLFRGAAAPACLDHGDTTGDGDIKVSDLTLLIAYLFRGGAAPVSCS